MYLQPRAGTGATVIVKGLSKPAEEGSVVSDSDEPISSAGKEKKKKKKIGNLSDLTASDLSDSKSVD